MSLIKRWDGTSWIDAPVMYWNGTSWVKAKVLQWDGSKWVTLQGSATATLTFNATGYFTRSATTAKDYLKPLVSSTVCKPGYVGYYEEWSEYGYMTFDFAAIKAALAGKILVNATFSAKISSMTADSMVVNSELSYSDASGSDAYGYYGYNSTTYYPSSVGSTFNYIDSPRFASHLQNFTRTPYAIEVSLTNQDYMTGSTGATFTEGKITITYEV